MDDLYELDARNRGAKDLNVRGRNLANELNCPHSRRADMIVDLNRNSAPAACAILASSTEAIQQTFKRMEGQLPYNGSAADLRGPPQGFRRGYVGRRQTAKAARELIRPGRSRRRRSSTNTRQDSSVCSAFHEKATPVKSCRAFRSSFIAVAAPAPPSHPPGFHPHSS